MFVFKSMQVALVICEVGEREGGGANKIKSTNSWYVFCSYDNYAFCIAYGSPGGELPYKNDRGTRRKSLRGKRRGRGLNFFFRS